MDDFIRLPYRIYAGCRQYVPDLEGEVRKLFNQQKNPVYEFALVQPFVAYRDGECVGRIGSRPLSVPSTRRGRR